MISSTVNKAAYPFSQFQKLFGTIPQDKKILVVLDIDDTIIQPAVRLNPLIDALKTAAVENSTNQAEVSLINQLVAEWRLKREVILTDDSWPTLLQRLQETVKVVALTKMDTGAFGHIKSIEEWRYNELKDKGLVFKEAAQDEVELFPKGGSYYAGIYFTGNENKGNILQNFILPREGKDCNYLVLLDDKEAQLTNMTSAVAKDSSITVQSLQFIPSKPSEKLGSFEREFIDKIFKKPSLKSCVEIQEIAQKLKNDLAPD